MRFARLRGLAALDEEYKLGGQLVSQTTPWYTHRPRRL